MIDPRLQELIDRGMCGPHYYGEQDENGVDLSLIREAMKLSAEERLRRADDGYWSAMWLRKHARRIIPKPAETSGDLLSATASSSL